MEYYLDDGKSTHFLSKRQVNLVVGASGAGKTTLVFQLYKASQTGTPFLGMHIGPVKWAYISGDRSTESVLATMERVGVTDLPVFSLVDEDMIGQNLVKKIIPMLPKKLGYKPELIMIDGFSAMVPDGESSDYFKVCNWLASLQRYCARQNITILGIVHVSKIREGSELRDPRQQAMGSNAFGGYTEDQLIINRIYKKGEENNRLIYILPRNGEERLLKASFEGGTIVLSAEDAEKHNGVTFVLESLLIPGATFGAHQFEQQAILKGVSRRTYYRWLEKLVKDGRLLKTARGEYRVFGGVVTGAPRPYETSESTEAGAEKEPEAGTKRVLDKPAGGDLSEENLPGEVSQAVDDQQRGADDAGLEEVRGAEATGEV